MIWTPGVSRCAAIWKRLRYGCCRSSGIWKARHSGMHSNRPSAKARCLSSCLASTLVDAHEGYVESVAFDQSGSRLLSAGYNDKTARLWDLTTDPPAQIQAFPKAQDMLLWAALTPDGQAMASVGRGSLVQVYSTQGAQLLHRLVGHESTVYRAIFSPDGHQLATGSADATLRLWDLGTGGELFSLRLPTYGFPPVPLWDFDFRCTPTGCWIAVPLTLGKLALYEFGKIDD
jgi:WD40 repeat protein